MRFVALGILLWLLLPAWALVVIVVLVFMHVANRKPTPKRRRR
jgi:hypothetical protein